MQLARHDRVLSAKHVPYFAPCAIGIKLRSRSSGRLSSNNSVAAVAINRLEQQSVVSHPSALLLPVTIAASVLLAFPAAAASASDFSLSQHFLGSRYLQLASIQHEQLLQQHLPAEHSSLPRSYGSANWTASLHGPPATHGIDTTSKSVTDLAIFQMQHQQLTSWTTPSRDSAERSRTLPSNVFRDSCSSCGSSSSLAFVADGSSPSAYSSLPPIPINFPQLPKLKEPQIYQEVLPNGLEVFLLEDKEVPLTRGSILMEGGQASGPPDKVGLPSIAAAVQRSGGSRTHPADVIDDRLEDLAAAIEASAGQQATTIDFQCVSEDTTEILQLLYELLTQPALPQDKLDVVKAQARSAIEHRDDNAASVARRELYKLLYGEDSIYARTSTLSGIASITPGDLASFIATWQRPDSAILGLVGDFDSQQMMQTIKQVLGPWSHAPGQPSQPPTRPREQLQDLQQILRSGQDQESQQQGREQQQEQQQGQEQQQEQQQGQEQQQEQQQGQEQQQEQQQGQEQQQEQQQGQEQQQEQQQGQEQQQEQQQGQEQQQRVVYLMDRPEAGQSSVYAGENGLRLSDPDVYALDVLSSRLNGFGGVLFDELRTREGLAYSVSAGWDTPVDHTGLFVAAAETGQPAKFIKSLSRVLASTRERPLTADELSKAKAGLLNSFVFNFASSYSQLQRTMVYQLLGLPQDFLFRYKDCVEAVTPEQIVQAARRHLHPEQEVVVVVGDAAVVGPQLRDAGFFVQTLKPKSAA